jgi:hypothetical protein
VPEFTILERRADHSDAVSYPLEAADIDDAAELAIANCPPDSYVAAVWQRDTPAELVAWHAITSAPD